MNYNFDQMIERRNTASYKWDQVERLFGDPAILPMWVADMDFAAPPSVLEAIKKRVDHGVLGYTIRPQSYYDAIMGWLKRRHDWKIEQEWITTSPGVVTALSMLVDLLTQPGDKVIIQTPVYPPFYDVVNKNNRTLIQNPLLLEDRYYSMDFAALEEQMMDPETKLMLLCNPHNPVGRVWRREELIQLGDLALKHGVFIISDEIHCDWIYPGYQHIPFASLSEEFALNSITCIAPTKTFNLAGIQTSTVIIADPSRRKEYNDRLSTLSLHLESCFGLIAVEAAFNEGDEWLDELIEYVRSNLEYLTDFIGQYLPKIDVIKPEGTYLVWLDFRKLGLNSTQLKELMYQQAKVAFNEGSSFGKNGEGFLRVNLACPRAILIEGLDRLKKALTP
ncbi:MalY/PatB family protein [Ammoniphilus sp. YIM 78166]|uniref:MalY/PatB family protein n=1 Tax=Ammoniphilus sp. YIM 78166 TaxID=1644106 RepID=UPI00106F48B1|nr:MalY/PatB family protein [Ammoniphilus sp. YIM 78166]